MERLVALLPGRRVMVQTGFAPLADESFFRERLAEPICAFKTVQRQLVENLRLRT